MQTLGSRFERLCVERVKTAATDVPGAANNSARIPSRRPYMYSAPRQLSLVFPVTEGSSRS